jgi:hypothetical protein
VTLNQAVVRNVGTWRLDVKRDVQGRNPEDQRIDARHRDGATRSSEEPRRNSEGAKGSRHPV